MAREGWGEKERERELKRVEKSGREEVGFILPGYCFNATCGEV